MTNRFRRLAVQGAAIVLIATAGFSLSAHSHSLSGNAALTAASAPLTGTIVAAGDVGPFSIHHYPT